MSISFVHFVVIVTVLSGLQHFGGYFASDNKSAWRRDFIPLLPASFNFEKLFSTAGEISDADPVLNQELIQWSLDYVEKIPDFKFCFPEIKSTILEFCSSNVNFISEFQYTVLALRIYNCLYLRSVGAEEVDFENIEQNYMKYFKKLTKVEWHLFQEAYNVVRGLCANERQDKIAQEVLGAAKDLRTGMAYSLNNTKRMNNFMYSTVELTRMKIKTKFIAEERILKRVEKNLNITKYHWGKKLQCQTELMRNTIKETGLFIESLENTMHGFESSLESIFERMDNRLCDRNVPSSLLRKLPQMYSSKTVEMEF